jgi:hypothetical protein
MAKDKFKRFHIIIGGDGGYIIRSTNKEEKVESWIEAFVCERKVGTFIQVYEHIRDGVYRMTLDKNEADIPKTHSVPAAVPMSTPSNYRAIGFERW